MICKGVDVSNYLYRFRPVDRLLGRKEGDINAGELARQYIFFAALDQLNDPMEGYKDIFWSGDQIVWKNLFKHYLLCLSHAYMLFALSDTEGSLHASDIPFRDPYSFYEHSGAADYYEELMSEFFGNEVIGSYISKLAQRTIPLRRNELQVHLDAIHLVAFQLVCKLHTKRGLVTTNGKEALVPESSLNAALEKSLGRLDMAEAVVAQHDNDESAIDALFAATINASEQLRLIKHYDQTYDVSSKNKRLIVLDFPRVYLSKLEQLVHADAYIACFMSDCSDSSVWGSYGNKHEGVCLKFKTIQANGGATLKLRTPNTWSSSRGVGYSDVPHQLREVVYKAEYPTIDFFRSLGSLSLRTLNTHWYSDGGAHSEIIKSGMEYDDQWRSEYFSNFLKALTTKLADWKYEQEHRIVLHSDLADYENPEERKLRYDFNDLDGIIFGIKTPLEDKLEIIKVIETKCKEHARTDFKFYQAYYSRQLARIEYAELSLLKFAL